MASAINIPVKSGRYATEKMDVRANSITELFAALTTRDSEYDTAFFNPSKTLPGLQYFTATQSMDVDFKDNHTFHRVTMSSTLLREALAHAASVNSPWLPVLKTAERHMEQSQSSLPLPKLKAA
jgi:hypothetical protein